MTEENPTKKEIRARALALFAERGYRETSVRDIAERAGVNLSMISYYFGGKKGLLESIVTEVAEGFSSYIRRFDLDNLEALFPLFEEFLFYLEDNRTGMKILLQELDKGYECLLPIKRRIGELQAKLAEFMIQERKGEAFPERSLRILTDVILGMLFSDFLLDFTGFQEGVSDEEKVLWRREKIAMHIRILERIAGLESGRPTFEGIMGGNR